MEFQAFIAGVPLAVAVSLAAAQSVPPPYLPIYTSALEAYQPYREEKLANWRDLNGTMGALGGHSAHLREVAKTVTAVGMVLEIDRGTSRVRIESDGVKALGWPAGIAYWLLKSPSLVDQIKPGQRVSFTLEQDGDVYRIAGFDGAAPPAPSQKKPADPHAGHNMAAPKPAAPAAQPVAPKPPHDMKNMGGMK